MCFVWLSEQTATISLINIKLITFVMDTLCDIYEVCIGSLNSYVDKFHVSNG